MWEHDRNPTCRDGLELHRAGSRLVAYDTGERITTPAALVEALPRLSLRSFFYHVHDACTRSHRRRDDFTVWLEEYHAESALIAKLRAIDFYSLNLNLLRARIIDVFRQRRPMPNTLLKAGA